MSSSPSDHLLRMLAAVPVSSQILDLGCGEGRHTEPLLRLGFPVHACDPRPEAVSATRERVKDLLEDGTEDTAVQVTPLDAIEYPDSTFDWIVATEAEIYVSSEADLRTFFEEGRRLLKPGGWLYLTLPAAEESSGAEQQAGPTRFSSEAVEAQRTAANLDQARSPSRVEDDAESGPRLRALYRCVEPNAPM